LVIPEHVQQSIDGLLASAGFARSEPYILLAPGASCSARRYDPHRFGQVAAALPGLAGLRVIVIGSQREAAGIAPVIRAADFAHPGSIISLVGQTSVLELAELIKRSKLVIANNSASLHMADAFLRPMVILYSGTEYLTQWQPRFAPARLLRVETDCSPCYNFQCPFSMECLDIQPEEVLEASLTLLNAELKAANRPAEVAVK
jgi:ADP-heptose:LPS heptosyltransferase